MKIKLNLFGKKWDFWRELAAVIFPVSFITFLALFAVDYVFPGFVSNWFNPVWLLIIAAVCVIIQQDKFSSR